MSRNKKTAFAIGALAAATILAGCSTADETTPAPTVTQEQAAPAQTTEAVTQAISIIDPVVRATDETSMVSPETGKLMTAAFMQLANASDADIKLIGGSSPVAGKVEIHEVADGEMKMTMEGITIPAGGTETLRMGGYHVMLMDLTGPVAPGDEIELTLTFSDGSSQTLTVTARTISMQDENYGPAGGSMDMEMGGEMGADAGMTEEGMTE